MLPIAIGKIEAIFRYPVKSMRGEPLDSVSVGWHGLEGDRRLALRRLNERGGFRMELRDGHIDLAPGQFLIVPKGVEHRPVAERECQVMLFEPATTLNTGDVRNERTLERLERL